MSSPAHLSFYLHSTSFYLPLLSSLLFLFYFFLSCLPEGQTGLQRCTPYLTSRHRRHSRTDWISVIRTRPLSSLCPMTLTCIFSNLIPHLSSWEISSRRGCINVQCPISPVSLHRASRMSRGLTFLCSNRSPIAPSPVSTYLQHMRFSQSVPHGIWQPPASVRLLRMTEIAFDGRLCVGSALVLWLAPSESAALALSSSV